MSEENLSEEDIWEYKSIRKSKVGNSDVFNSVQKATDGQCKPKRCELKNKRIVKVKEKSKDDELYLGERDSQTLGSEPVLNSGNNIQQSPDKVTTKAKCGKTNNKKLTPTKLHPVYSGYCPSCQMPFSLLLGQTPRWHVSECLDGPRSSERECPDGLLCNSTIPSHYTRYAHFLLAQSRAGNDCFSSPASPSSSKLLGSSDTKSDFLCSLEERWPQCQKQAENAKYVSNDPLLIALSPRKFQSPNETNKKISFSTNISKSLQTMQFTEFVDNDKLESSGLPLADGELDRHKSSEHLNLPLPKTDLSDCEISYSPLQSDDETYDIEEQLENSQKELFIAENSGNYSSEEEDDSCILFRRLCGTLQKEYKPDSRKMKSYINQDDYDEELNVAYTLNDLSKPVSQHEKIKSCEPANATNHFKCFPTSLAGELNPNYQVNKEGPDEPKLFSSQSSGRSVSTEESAACNWASQQSLNSEMSQSLESEEEKTSQSTQSEVIEESNRSFYGKKNSHIVNFHKEPLGSKPSVKASVLDMEAFPNKTTAHRSTEILLPCTPNSNTKPSSTKVLKQMDIGVFFGLPPKAKEEKTPENCALKRTKNASPKEKQLGQSKRKREGSLGDLELDIHILNRTKTSVESSYEGSQRRKSFRKSATIEERTQSRETDEVMNKRVANKIERGGSQRWRRRSQDSVYTEAVLREKKCPFYKKIPGTGFTVDAFQYGAVEGCTAYFLTHFHSDHYAGLSKKFTFPVYCSKITSNLVKKKLGVQEQYLYPLPLNTVCTVNGIKVVLLDANHCPGAVMILVYLPNGTVTLHTGDFRADPSMERCSLLANQKVHTLYLDTTYCSPEYTFPSQQEVIQFAVNIAFETVTLSPQTLVVCGTYSLGKEKIFLAIADVLGSKVSMSQEKYKTLQCLELQEVNSLMTTDWSKALVHILPMMQINFKGLQNHLNKCGGKYDRVLAFRPTGWTHSEKFASVEDIVPQAKGNISIYGIPYSEHSSYLEMKRFVQWLKPQKIIATVNVGSWKSRNTMEKYFNEWKHEAGY